MAAKANSDRHQQPLVTEADDRLGSARAARPPASQTGALRHGPPQATVSAPAKENGHPARQPEARGQSGLAARKPTSSSQVPAEMQSTDSRPSSSHPLSSSVTPVTTTSALPARHNTVETAARRHASAPPPPQQQQQQQQPQHRPASSLLAEASGQGGRPVGPATEKGGSAPAASAGGRQRSFIAQQDPHGQHVDAARPAGSQQRMQSSMPVASAHAPASRPLPERAQLTQALPQAQSSRWVLAHQGAPDQMLAEARMPRREQPAPARTSTASLQLASEGHSGNGLMPAPQHSRSDMAQLNQLRPGQPHVQQQQQLPQQIEPLRLDVRGSVRSLDGWSSSGLGRAQHGSSHSQRSMLPDRRPAEASSVVPATSATGAHPAGQPSSDETATTTTQKRQRSFSSDQMAFGSVPPAAPSGHPPMMGPTQRLFRELEPQGTTGHGQSESSASNQHRSFTPSSFFHGPPADAPELTHRPRSVSLESSGSHKSHGESRAAYDRLPGAASSNLDARQSGNGGLGPAMYAEALQSSRPPRPALSTKQTTSAPAAALDPTTAPKHRSADLGTAGRSSYGNGSMGLAALTHRPEPSSGSLYPASGLNENRAWQQVRVRKIRARSRSCQSIICKSL